MSSARQGVGRASALLASGTFVSRVLGFISALVLAQTIGTLGAGADTFALANQLPNTIYSIVAGSILSAVLVPQIVRAGLHDDGGQRFINRIVTLGVVIFIAATAIATACAPLLVNLYAQQASGGSRGFSPTELALSTAFAYWCLPQILFYALYSLLGEVLNARGHFGAFTWAPALNNVVAIGGLIAFRLMFVGRDVSNAIVWTPDMIAVLAGTATLGVAVQAVTLFFFWRNAGLHYRPEFRWKGVGLGRVGKAAGWSFAMIMSSQLAGIVQSNVASQATGDASLQVLRLSWLIVMLPHSLVTVSIGTAYFTRMSGHVRDGDTAALRSDISTSMRTIGMLIVFSTTGLMVLAYPFSSLFSTTGFSGTVAMGNVLIAFLPGLIPLGVLFITQRTFFAFEQTRLTFFIQFFQSALFVIGALLVSLAPTATIGIGIAVVMSVTTGFQTLLSLAILRKRLGGIDARRVLRQYSLFLLAAIPSTVVGVLIVSALGAFSGGFAVSGFLNAAVAIVAAGFAMLVVYVAALFLLRSPEVIAFAAPVLSRLARRN